MKQEAEQQLISDSIFINPDDGIPEAELPFVVPPEENRESSRTQHPTTKNHAVKLGSRGLNQRNKASASAKA